MDQVIEIFASLKKGNKAGSFVGIEEYEGRKY